MDAGGFIFFLLAPISLMLCVLAPLVTHASLDKKRAAATFLILSSVYWIFSLTTWNPINFILEIPAGLKSNNVYYGILCSAPLLVSFGLYLRNSMKSRSAA